MNHDQSTTSTSPAPPRRRWPQFRLRTVLWLLIAGALCLGWWIDRQRLAEHYRRAELLFEAQRLARDPRFTTEADRDAWMSMSKTGGVVLGGWANLEFENNATVPPLERYGLDSNTRFFLQALAATGNQPPLYEERVAALVRIISEPETERRARAARTLALPAWRDAAAVPALIQALDDPQRVVRWHAAYTLGEFGPVAADATPRLREMVDHEDSVLSAFAAQMLLKIDPQADVGSRLVTLLADEHADARRRAALALARSSRPVGRLATERLLALLADADPNVRQSACKAVAQHVPREAALDALLAAFQEEQDATTRALIARELTLLDAAR